MSKRCAKCEKPVYPIEELKCLDKIWHKSCFKCENCGMTLNMKNYKGYDKKPYCVAHYPTTKFTAVADTPENRRIATNTKLQSSVQYHSEFEKTKDKYTAVADNPEVQRCMAASKNASLIKYHEDFEKQKGKRITVADDPELQRIKQNTQIQSEISYKGIKQTRDIMEQRRPEQAAQDGHSLPPPPMSTAAVGGYPTSGYGQPGKISDYDPYQENSTFNSPYSAKSQATTIYDSRIGQVENGSSRRIGSIADYDPLNNQYGSTVPEPEQQAPAGGHNPYAGKGMVSKAIYDYTAADTDEVSFVEGDIIIHCQPIDQGWMEGTVERTAQRGMLPSNYVQPV